MADRETYPSIARETPGLTERCRRLPHPKTTTIYAESEAGPVRALPEAPCSLSPTQCAGQTPAADHCRAVGRSHQPWTGGTAKPSWWATPTWDYRQALPLKEPAAEPLAVLSARDLPRDSLARLSDNILNTLSEAMPRAHGGATPSTCCANAAPSSTWVLLLNNFTYRPVVPATERAGRRALTWPAALLVF